jgi:Mg-chelatase subunit ChlD
MSDQHTDDQTERLRRWRLLLGGPADGTNAKLNENDQHLDDTLAALYGDQPGLASQSRDRSRPQPGRGDGASERGDGQWGGLGTSAPSIARWLGDIRDYFPNSVVKMMQRDAIDRLELKQLLLEPDLLEMVEPDVHLVADIIALSQVMPNTTKDSAQRVVRGVVEELKRKLHHPMQQAIQGALNRSERNYRPRHHEINWHGTIRRNLKHYQPDLGIIIPETLIGYGKRRSSLRDVILCVDQSGSMASSVVYSSIFGAVLASLPAMNTHMVVFDTSVVDLTAKLDDPVELLFGTQLGGGTDINRALQYCQQVITRPRDTILVLISDLYEGGRRDHMLRQVRAIVEREVKMVALLSLSDDGTPSYDNVIATEMKQLGVPAFACTPDLFPDMMAAAIQRDDLGLWASRHQIVTAG